MKINTNNISDKDLIKYLKMYSITKDAPNERWKNFDTIIQELSHENIPKNRGKSSPVWHAKRHKFKAQLRVRCKKLAFKHL